MFLWVNINGDIIISMPQKQYLLLCPFKCLSLLSSSHACSNNFFAASVAGVINSGLQGGWQILQKNIRKITVVIITAVIF